MLAVILIAVLPVAFAKFAIPVERISEQLHGAQWDMTYRMANLAGPIAICDNSVISAQQTGAVTQEIANASAPEAQLTTSEYTAKGFWYWINSTGWDAESVSNDMSSFISELGSTHSDLVSEVSNAVYGCSVEPACEFAETNPCQATAPASCTLFVCMFASGSTEGGRSSSRSKSRRDANFLPLLDGSVPATAPKAKAVSLRDTYPRNATSYYNYLAQNNVRLQLAGNKDQEDIARMIMDHFQCDAFLDPKANMETIPWDTVPTYKDRNIDLMRRRSQLKPIFERVFVIDESDMSEEEKPMYREDTVVRLLQSVHRYANFVKMRFERVGCAYIPQCLATGSEYPLAVMVCVTVQSYNGPTPPPVRRTTTVGVPMTSQAPAVAGVTDSVPEVAAETTAPVVGTTMEQLVMQTIDALQVSVQSIVEATTVAPVVVVETATEPTESMVEPLEPVEPDTADPTLVEDMNNQKVKI